MPKVSGWGNYPTCETSKNNFLPMSKVGDPIMSFDSFIVRGNGRSYGDSSLWSSHVAGMKHLNRLLSFDPVNGLLVCESGVLLADIIELFVPKGWYLNVSSGTKFVTVGGAVASDIHGKNHHKSGCFSEFVNSLDILLSNGEIVTCSKSDNQELFSATCGGMGLTGIILRVSFYLMPIQSSNLQQHIIKTSGIKETVAVFDEYSEAEFSVAWLDCSTGSENFGRAVFSCGEFLKDGLLEYKRPASVNTPFFMPKFLLNNRTVNLFNSIYYHHFPKVHSKSKVELNKFFYPLDAITNWNRFYGKSGFLQYQFVVPRTSGEEGLNRVLEMIKFEKRSSFLSVLKLFGPQNKNYLSFPIEGFTLALDFPIRNGIFEFLNRLDEVVLSFGGRVYLAKDARLSEENFKKMYPKHRDFMAVRERYSASNQFKSLQSERLGL